MEKIAWDGPKWGREDFFPTNPDLADILDDTDFDFENLYIYTYIYTRSSGLRFARPSLLLYLQYALSHHSPGCVSYDYHAALDAL